jgi:hypothetical protein
MTCLHLCFEGSQSRHFVKCYDHPTGPMYFIFCRLRPSSLQPPRQYLAPHPRMRSSLVVRASDCQCTSCNGPGFDPSIRRHSGIWGAADETVLNIVQKKKKKSPKKYLKKKKKYLAPTCHLSTLNLKVPKCEIFHLFDFNDLYGIKSL